MQLPEKSQLALSQQPPLTIEILSTPPFLNIWQKAQPTSRNGGERMHTMIQVTNANKKIMTSYKHLAFT